MKKRIYIPILIVCVLIIVFFGLFFYQSPKDNLAVAAQKFTLVKTAATSLPLLLEIPKIGLKDKVEDVGLTSGGNMDTPKNAGDVGWYKYGVTPGEKGSAVIDGHLDNFLGLPAAFWNLNKLSVGDDIYVINQSGQTLHFRVTDIKIYDYNTTDTTAIFKSSDNASHLNLITCNGSWLENAKSYNKRLVIFSVLL